MGMVNNQTQSGVRMSELSNDLSFEEQRAENIAMQNRLDDQWREKEKRKEERRLKREESYKKMAMAAGSEMIAEYAKNQAVGLSSLPCGAINPNLLLDTP